MDKAHLKHVDYGSLLWQHSFAMETASFIANSFCGQVLDGSSNTAASKSKLGQVSNLDVLECNVEVGIVVGDISPSLAHTVTLLCQTWSKALLSQEEKADSVTIFNHYIIVNNMSESVYFSQVGTDENLELPMLSFLGYSWRNNKCSKVSRERYI